MSQDINYTVDLKSKYEELKKNPKVTDDMEYYFVSAQILKYFGYVTRRQVYIRSLLHFKSDKAFKKGLKGRLRHFKFPKTERGKAFEMLYKEVLEYNPKIEKGDLKDTFFIGGCVLDLIV